MKVWIAIRQDYEDLHIIGMFSTKQRAEEGKQHHFAEYEKTGNKYFTIRDYFVNEFELDDYYTKNCTKLSKALL